MYRQSRQVRVTRTEVLRFLLQDPDFPRSVLHCIGSVELGATRLPRNDSVLRHSGRLKRTLIEADVGRLRQEELHSFVDGLQLTLGELHSEITHTWFLHDNDLA